MTQAIGKAPPGAKEVEDFFGVYLLYCLNPKYKARTYIGFTVDPNRRISQHNRGAGAGGAMRTSNKGPWEMVLITHGFPNQIAALRFEWSWQHPKRSRRLNQLPPKKSREKSFDYCLRVLASMLNTEPWSRLPLTVRWLNPDFQQDFHLDPPLHMPMVQGPVKSVKPKKPSKKALAAAEADPVISDEEDDLVCNLCFRSVTSATRMDCLNPRCRTVSHAICLSDSFLAAAGELDQMIPIQGSCMTCSSVQQWGDLVRRRRGCFKNIQDISVTDEED